MMSVRSRIAWPGAPFALGSAALFGASTPLAKLLLGDGVSPWLLAGLLYLGSGVGLTLFDRLRGAHGEARLGRGDLGWMALVILSGGVVAPVLLMLGLSTTPASSASLLLNLEGLATMAIAWVVFRENVDRRLLLGAAAILAGALILSWNPAQGFDGIGIGALAIAGACLCWGIDNNLTRKLSGSDPVQIAMVKGLAAGSVNLAIALGSDAAMPPPALALAAGLVGLAGYGISLVLFVLALRHLGTARTGAYFSSAPFIGALLSVLLLGDVLGEQLLLAGGLMGLGLYLHLVERHEHEHAHDALEHDHAHVHDDHHQHQHEPEDPSGEPHSHHHRHTPLIHRHPHYPDLHHRHRH